ncbi:MAG: polysaccharide biosynthesis/export family protein [Bacteroidia bacterium]
MRKLLFILLTLTSCSGLAPNRMFKTPKDYKFAVDTANADPSAYKIQIGDKLELHIFSNNGFKLVDLTDAGPYGATDKSSAEILTYLVEPDSLTKFPVLGRLNLVGLSLKEAETKLEQLYSKYYNDPFIVLKVVNRHAIVFLGDGGKGFVVELQNDNTTLFEVLAKAGGISDLGEAGKIRIVRGNPNNPSVYAADISSVEALKNSELKVYSNDIIYVDAGSRLAKRISTDVVPILSLATTIFVVLNYVSK